MTPSSPDVLNSLLALSHDLGREDRDLAILGEGNTSTRTGPDSFLVKASGSSLGTLTAAQVTACRIAPLVALLDHATFEDTAVDQALLDARIDPAARKPSVEAMFHAAPPEGERRLKGSCRYMLHFRTLSAECNV
jgi:rhamnose utilization protein RhaD (predicted bifunctional aldolase and dehydrogenase)